MTGPENTGVLVLGLIGAWLIGLCVAVFVTRGRIRSILLLLFSIPIWVWAIPAIFWTVAATVDPAVGGSYGWTFTIILSCIATATTVFGVRLWPRRDVRPAPQTGS